MRYKISADSLENISLGKEDAIASILQNIALILATRQGSVPLYRAFGLSWSLMDRPVSVVKPMLFARIKEAIETFEPRAQVVGVTFTDGEGPGGLIPTVEVEIHG